ncbi:hypothetical protein Tco_0250009, partial [Tanacetum coccineum]
EKDSPDDFYGFMYDMDDDASISGKSCEQFGWDWDSPEVAEEVVLYQPVHEDVVEEVIEMANDQDEALSDQKWLMNVWMMNRLKKEDQARGLESPKKRWTRMKSQRKANKDPLCDNRGLSRVAYTFRL